MEDNKGKQPKGSMWVRKALTKEPKFDLEHAKEKSMEAKKSFTEASTSSCKNQLEPGMDPLMLTTFLEACMKLLRATTRQSKHYKNLSPGALGKENRAWSENLESMNCAQ